jgi:hypothetical protein
MRTQALIETATNHKAAAVAASAVAMAGGGLAVEDATHVKRPPVVREAPRAAAPTLLAPKPAAIGHVAPSAPVTRTRPANARIVKPTATHRSRTRADARDAEPLIEPITGNGDASTAGATTSTPQTVHPSTKPLNTSDAATEFGFEKP